MSKSAFLPLALIVAGLTACSTAPPVTVRTDYDRGTRFGGYQTYALDAGPTGLSATGHAALQESLRSNLAARGFKEASSKTADLYIISVVLTQEKIYTIPTGNASYVPSRYGRYGGTWLMNTTVNEYTEGSLVIDFVDRKTRKLVFRGLGQAAVGTQERNAAAIKEAVSQIVAAYPAAGT